MICSGGLRSSARQPGAWPGGGAAWLGGRGRWAAGGAGRLGPLGGQGRGGQDDGRRAARHAVGGGLRRVEEDGVLGGGRDGAAGDAGGLAVGASPLLGALDAAAVVPGRDGGRRHGQGGGGGERQLE